MAAAQHTGLLQTLENALPVSTTAPTSRLHKQRPATNRQLSQTLLFMPVARQYRTWALRSYTGSQLALLSGKEKAYGYRTTERFLSEIAQAGGSETLTDGLARWTHSLWQEKFQPQTTTPDNQAATFYVDGHHKAVYSDKLIPRGLVGRLGKVLGCRGLVLLHDELGHPLLALTSRGDQHLTTGLPQIVSRFEEAVGNQFKIKRIIADREVMAGEFLASELEKERVLVTLLKENQYEGTGSFKQVGEFSPWLYDKKKERVVREVATATFELKVTSPLTGQPLLGQVALIRDWRRRKTTAGEQTSPKLIPIVTTTPEEEVVPLSPPAAVKLATDYRNRWPLQENIIKDWLVTLGLDINHGFKKTAVANSEVSKRRNQLQHRIATTQKRLEGAQAREKKAGTQYHRCHEKLLARSKQLAKELDRLHEQLLEQTEYHRLNYEQKMEYERAKNKVNEELDELREHKWEAYSSCNQEFGKEQAYSRQHKELIAELEKLNARERQMLELDNRKDQVMTVFKLALANLGMWVRDKCFPADYARCSWQRLRPFFELGGWISQGATVVKVNLKPFNDRALNRDLEKFCELVTKTGLALPDGRQIKLALCQEQTAEIKKPLVKKKIPVRKLVSSAHSVPFYSVRASAG